MGAFGGRHRPQRLAPAALRPHIEHRHRQLAPPLSAPVPLEPLARQRHVPRFAPCGGRVDARQGGQRADRQPQPLGGVRPAARDIHRRHRIARGEHLERVEVQAPSHPRPTPWRSTRPPPGCPPPATATTPTSCARRGPPRPTRRPSPRPGRSPATAAPLPTKRRRRRPHSPPTRRATRLQARARPPSVARHARPPPRPVLAPPPARLPAGAVRAGRPSPQPRIRRRPPAPPYSSGGVSSAPATSHSPFRHRDSLAGLEGLQRIPGFAVTLNPNNYVVHPTLRCSFPEPANMRWCAWSRVGASNRPFG